MQQQLPDPAIFEQSPTRFSRRRLEALLSLLARGYVESLRPMERVMVESLSRARGWDLDRLATGRGPLAPVSDWALNVLVHTFATELLAAALDLEAPEPANLDAALAELKAALG